MKVQKMKYFDNMLDYSNYISKELLNRHHEVEDSKMQKLFKRKVEFLKNCSKVYEPYTFYKGWYDTFSFTIIAFINSRLSAQNIYFAFAQDSRKDCTSRSVIYIQTILI